MFLPARSHRFLGLLALILSLAIVAAVLVPLARASWSLAPFDIGFWFAIAVAALGLLGALKALATGRKYDSRPAAP
jgi:NADH:ubiquinone oxidoreductase subunit H